MTNEQSKSVNKVIFWLATILGLALALFGIDKYIDYKVDNAVTKPEVIEKLRERVRPMLIFDENGAILSDMGARQYIEDDIELEKTKDGNSIKRVKITLKNPCSIPILTCLDNTVDYVVDPKRGKGLEIVYDLNVNSYSKPRAKTSLFNLEVISGEALQYQVTEVEKKRTMYFPGKIVADELEMTKKYGQARFQAAMYENPTYKPVEGDLYFNSKIGHWVTYSKGKWRKLLMEMDSSTD